MSLLPSTCSDRLRLEAASLGISRLGIAASGEVETAEMERYRGWLTARRHGDMDYLERHARLRNNPSLLLPGTRSVIVAAFNYYPPSLQHPGAPQFAYYAYGRDYHEVVREKLGKLAASIMQLYGGDTRVCVDTAPLPERYWAIRAGIGFRGLNSQLIIPGKGSYFFLGEILSTVAFSPDPMINGDCGKCGACLKACPGAALCGDSTVDATRCLSYLTIEYRGDTLPPGTPAGNRVYGCDACQQVCPHNRHAKPTGIPDFIPTEEFLNLDNEALANLTPEKFNALFRHSAVKRTKFKGLMRNFKFICDSKSD